MRSLMAIYFLFIFTMGCATAQRRSLSAGLIGCPEDEIQISNENEGWSASTWTASCRGQRFFCSSGGIIACKEELKKK